MAILKRKFKKGSATTGLGEQASSVISSGNLLKIAVQNGVQRVPLDVYSLAKSLGVQVQTEILSDNVSGKLESSNGKWSITVNAIHHPRRQRFTLAHEIAHYCLHRGNQNSFTDTVLFRDNNSNSVEWEANRFAAEILMPKDEFKKYVESHTGNIEDIATHFEVSTMAVRVRAKELGYTGHNL